MRARRRTAPAQSSSKNELRVGVASPEDESDPSPDPSSDDGVADEVDRGVEVDGVAEEVDRGLVVDGDEVDGVDRSLLLGVSESSEDPERSVPEVETYRDIAQPPYSGSSTNPSWVSPVEVVSPRSHTPTIGASVSGSERTLTLWVHVPVPAADAVPATIPMVVTPATARAPRTAATRREFGFIVEQPPCRRGRGGHRADPFVGDPAGRARCCPAQRADPRSIRARRVNHPIRRH
ncbi:hypothetical protein Ae505Ps2_4870c [Pseudonocardia sp. Ae505_Ps2]|nr:hypothetical protein Ae505Ps2_4870c [Pseudonocardia sp. Ae505_Ps2]